jgi:nucleotide-binding universal stress UspA family protein
VNTILVAVDLKPSDSLLLDEASRLAEKFSSKIWLIHIAAPDPDFVGYRTGPTYIRDMRAEELHREHQQLHSMAQSLAQKRIQSEALLIQGPTVEMLKEEVEKLNIELLIMGSHKRGFLYDTWFGHTSVRVLKKIPVKVLIIPLPDEE